MNIVRAHTQEPPQAAMTKRKQNPKSRATCLDFCPGTSGIQRLPRRVGLCPDKNLGTSSIFEIMVDYIPFFLHDVIS